MTRIMFALTAIWIVAFSNVALGLIVIVKNRGNFTNTSFAVFTFILAVWLIASYYSNDVALSHALQLWLNRVTLFLPGLGLYFLLLFSLEFTRFGYKYFRSFAWVFGLFTLGLSIVGTTPLLIRGITPRSSVVAISFGPLTPEFSIFITLLFLSIIFILVGSIRHLTGSARARTKIMAASLFLALAITVVTNLILPVAANNYSYVLLGLLSTFIIVGGFTYAIVRHRLFDIRTVVAKSVAYLLLLTTLGGGYAIITFKVGGLLFAHSNISAPQQTFNVLTALVLALTFQPLKGLFERLTDKVFYRERYEPQKLINQVSKVLAEEIGLVNLSHRVRAILVHNMRVESVNVVVLNNNAVFAEAGHYVVSRLEDLARDLGNLRGRLIVAEEELDGHRKQVLQQYGISVMVVLRTKKDGRIGYLLFGEKLNGDIYTEMDLRVIRIIADQLAVAIQNAKAYVQIQRFNQTLQSKVVDATKQLRDANTSLQTLDNVKDEFISVASHQLRTPLTIIDGYLSNLLDGIYGPFNTQQRQAIELTHNRLRLTAGLVTDLLNLSRMEAGRFFIDPSPVNLDKLVEEEIVQLKLKATEEEVKLSYESPVKPMKPVMLDEQKTRQVIMNLIDNAIIYSPSGSTIKISLGAIGNQAIFEVADHGIGVPDSEQDKLFQKFFRASNAKKHRADGTGIGLYLVKRVVEEQGGNVIFSSKEGEGSTFGFRVPMTPVTKTAISRLPRSKITVTNRS